MKFCKKILLVFLVLMMTACGPKAPEEPQITFTPGTYTGTGNSIGGQLKIDVTFDETSITDLVLVETHDTKGVCEQAFEIMKERIVNGQTLNVDAASGATMSSKAILAAVEDTVAQANGSVESLKQKAHYPANETLEKRTLETDVVVVGAGMAGLSAGISALQNGADVILVEKLDIVGGTSTFAGGGLSGSPNEEDEAAYLAQLNYLDSLFEDSKYPEEHMIQTLASNQAETHQWLSELGIGFYYAAGGKTGYPIGVGSFAVPEGYHGGDYQILRLKQMFLENGGTLLTGTPAASLIYEDNTVKGIIAKDAQGEIEILAEDVILASGGFGRNKEMLAQYVPDGTDDITTTAVGNTGDGILMAQEIGADVYDEMHLMGCAGKWYPLDLFNYVYLSDSPVTGIYVGSDGLRRIDEDNLNYVVHAKFFEDGQDYYWSIYTEEMLAAAEKMDRVNKGIEFDSTKYVKADSIEELAEKSGIDVENLVNTITVYNQYCADQMDPEFGKSAANLIPFTEGPYYAIYTANVAIGTNGGLVTNEMAQVLDAQGNAIDHLYAAGEISYHGFLNVSYCGGYALSIDVTMGKIAGEQAAKN